MTRPARLLAVFGAMAAAAALAACGFTPMYASGTGVRSELSGIEVRTGEGRPQYMLGVALRDRLGVWEGDAAQYVLTTNLDIRRISQQVTVAQEARRILLSARVNYALYDRISGARLTSGAVDSSATYDVPDGPYAAIRTEQDAQMRAAEAAANRLTLDLARFFHDREAASAQRAGGDAAG